MRRRAYRVRGWATLNPKVFTKELKERLETAKATGRRQELVDGDGLYLDITPGGATVWRYRYRLNGRREKITVGAYPKIGLAEARDHRAILAGRAAKSKRVEGVASPAAQAREQEKQAERVAKLAGTVEDLGKHYLAHLRKRGKKSHTMATANSTTSITRAPKGAKPDLSPSFHCHAGGSAMTTIICRSPQGGPEERKYAIATARCRSPFRSRLHYFGAHHAILTFPVSIYKPKTKRVSSTGTHPCPVPPVTHHETIKR